MTVGELIKELQNYPPDMGIIVKDAAKTVKYEHQEYSGVKFPSIGRVTNDQVLTRIDLSLDYN